jgi:hypothetical protein
MQMQVQAIDEKGMLIDNAEVFVDGVPIGSTPNAITSLSGAIWKSYRIKASCDGYIVVGIRRKVITDCCIV